MTLQDELLALPLIAALDRRAEVEPDRTYVSIPQDNNDLKKGFNDITFKKFANAVSHAAHWLHAVLGSGQDRITTIAYIGLPDLHPAVLAAAAAKTGAKLLLPFPLAPPQAKKYLMQAAGCQALLFPAPLTQSMEQLLADDPQIKPIVVPSFALWFSDEESQPYRSQYINDKKKPWLIFHTSGTTGLPKLVIYTQEMLASLGLVQTRPKRNRIPSMSLFENRRVHSSIPSVHLVGMIGSLTSPILVGTQIVMGPMDRPPSAETITGILRYGQIEGLVTAPVRIRHLVAQAEGLELLKNLKFLSWAGTALDKFSGDALCQHIQLSPSFGTTECGPFWTWVTQDPEDWAYYSFMEGQGVEFEDAGDGLTELIIQRKSDAVFQQIFLLHPELEVYRTSDVFRKHPTKEGLWLYSGRRDDMFKLNSSWPIHYSSREQILEQNPAVKTALIGGEGQTIPFLLVDPAENVPDPLESIWHIVAKTNEDHHKKVAIYKDMIILADPARPFARSVKDTVLRKETIALYKPEIEARLVARDLTWNEIT